MPLRQSLTETEGEASSFQHVDVGAAAAVLAARTEWPDAVAFREAVQTPAAVLSDPLLRRAEVVADRRGFPLAFTGRFAIVFRLRDPETAEEWALRCFTLAAEGDERRRRYAHLEQHLAVAPGEVAAAFVPFRYLTEGVRVGGTWYPALAMRWATGETLGRFVERHRHDPPALLRLCTALDRLLHGLESAGISHGDWQHDNLIVSEGGRRITLVDYDGVWVTEMGDCPASEVGHPNYQHPQRSVADAGPGRDRFAFLVMQAGLLALACEPSLWDAYAAEGESLLFKAGDLASPTRSAVFRAVRLATEEHPIAALALASLERACSIPPAELTSGPFTGSLAGRLPELRLPERPLPPAVAVPWERLPLPHAERLDEARVVESETAASNEERAKAEAIVAAARKRVAHARRVMRHQRSARRQHIAAMRLAWVMLLLGVAVLFPVLSPGFAIGGDRSITIFLILASLLTFVGYSTWPRRRVGHTITRLAEENRAVHFPIKGRFQRARVALKRLNDDPTNRSAVSAVAEALRKTALRDVAEGLGLTTKELDRLLLSGILTMADLPPTLTGIAAGVSEASRGRLYDYRQQIVQSARAAFDVVSEERRSLQQQIEALERASGGLQDAEDELERYARDLGNAHLRRFLAEVFGL